MARSNPKLTYADLRALPEDVYLSELGFGEYWIVQPAQETVDVFRGGDWLKCAARASRVAGTPEAQALTTPLLPGCVITLDQIFDVPSFCR